MLPNQYLAKTKLTRWSDKEFATDLCEFCPESNPDMMCNMSILNFTFNGYADLLQKFRRTKPIKQSMCAPVSAGQQLSVEVPQMVPACSLWQNEKQAMTSTIQLREHFYCCAPTFLDFSARILSKEPSSAACGKLFKRSFETSTQESVLSSLCSTSSTLLLWFCSVWRHFESPVAWLNRVAAFCRRSDASWNLPFRSSKICSRCPVSAAWSRLEPFLKWSNGNIDRWETLNPLFVVSEHSWFAFW